MAKKKLKQRSGNVKSVIGFKNLRVRCVIGVDEAERKQEQDVIVDLRISTHICPSSDDVSETVDYTALSGICEKLAKNNRYHLIETLAYDILEEIFRYFPVYEGWIKIKKPKGVAGAEYAFVEITKTGNYGLDTCHRRC